MGYRRDGAYSDIAIIDDLCYQVLEDIQEYYDEGEINSVEECKGEAIKAIDADLTYTEQDMWSVLEELGVEDIEEPANSGCKTLKDVAVYYAYAEMLNGVNFYAVFDELQNDTLRDHI